MRVPDRQKQRRQYLKQKAGAYIKSESAKSLFWLLLLITVICGSGSFGSLLNALSFGLRWGPDISWFVLSVVLALLAAGGIYWCNVLRRYIDKAEQERAAILFVPPVSPDSLSVEEVLVRGAQEPIQEHGEILLRAAVKGTDTSAEHLLRATDMTSD